MPIKPENRKRYPADWRRIREVTLQRDSHACRDCGVPDGVWRNRKTLEWTRNPEQVDAWALDGEAATKIVLTVAHLDHQPENCAPANLRSLCQRCHLRYDREHHREQASHTRAERKAGATPELMGE